MNHNEHFLSFSEMQKESILRSCWVECLILRASHWSIDLDSIINRCDDKNLKYAIDSIKVLNADLIELSILETLILCRRG